MPSTITAATSAPGEGFADYAVARLRESYDATLHLLGDSLFDWVDDDTTAVETYVVAHHRIDEPASMVSFGGRYLDRVERRDGVWGIAERLVVREWDRREAIEPAWPPNRFVEGSREEPSGVRDGRSGD